MTPGSINNTAVAAPASPRPIAKSLAYKIPAASHDFNLIEEAYRDVRDKPNEIWTSRKINAEETSCTVKELFEQKTPVKGVSDWQYKCKY